MNSPIYTLYASLPALPDPDHAGTLPISRVQLDKRLEMLAPDELALTRSFEMVLHLFFAPCRLKKEPIASAWQETFDASRRYPALHRRVVMLRIAARVLGALRARNGEAVTIPPGLGDVAFDYRLRHRSDAPLFGLARTHPWLLSLEAALQTQHPVSLQHALDTLFFQEARDLMAAAPFTFEAVAGYLMGWQILRYRLESGAAEARTRLAYMLEEHAHG